jgi:4-hydroxy-tetrahydrodipicolinate reductase
MKIALLGYGKMGKVIERIAIERGHEIIMKKEEHDTFEGLATADVAIDFSVPKAAVLNISTCFNENVPVISGTTGWFDQYDAMVSKCNEKKSFISSSNFSLGVNIFFEMNEYLAKKMIKLDSYNLKWRRFIIRKS